MDSRIATELAKKVSSPFHDALLNHCKGLVAISRTAMSKYYSEWDNAQATYEGKREMDSEDKEACKKGAPSKIVVPLTYAQIQTFVAFGMNLLTQREHFYELEGTGEEDHRAAKLGEALLDQNLAKQQWTQKLYQALLDCGKFSIGIVKHGWTKETEKVWVEEQVPIPVPGFSFGNLLGRVFGSAPPAEQQFETKQVPKTQTSYLGNEIVSISPFKFFPDTRLPLTRMQEGEFCASEDEYSMSSLRQKQADGQYAGVEHIEKFRGGDLETRKRNANRFSGIRSDSVDGRGSAQSEATVVVTEVQVVLTPSQFKLPDGTPMGDSDVPEKWLVTYANDNRVIRAEPLGYVHNKFTYTIVQFSPDQHSLISEAIASMVGHLQAVIDWFINSHITNVRKHISNRLVVDPVGVEFSDLKEHKPVIRLKPAAANSGVDRYVKQLAVSDVTRSHITDVQVLMQFVSMTTAISDNLMGQYHTGRRSAREASNTATASSSRLRNVIKIMFDTAFLPMGECLISNLRDGLDEETFVTVTGDQFPDWAAYNHFKINDDRIKVGVDRTKLAGRYDFTLFDGTLPSEKQAQAETIEQILLSLMSNPQGIPILTQMLGYDPGKLFREVLILRGIKHPDRFRLDPVRMQEYLMAQQAQQALEQPQPQPNEPTVNPAGGGGPAGGPPQQAPAQQPSFSSLIAPAA